jgi:hypothetical protein
MPTSLNGSRDLALAIKLESIPYSAPTKRRPHNKSLLRTGGRLHSVCNEVVVMDKLHSISLGEPPGAELSRYASGALNLKFSIPVVQFSHEANPPF